MNRRDIMKLFGLGGAAAATPAAARRRPRPRRSSQSSIRCTGSIPRTAVRPRADAGGKVHSVRAYRHPDVQSVRLSLFDTNFGRRRCGSII
jgi:hypothetical protein